MTAFKITQEELTNFARKIYEEACCGYLDLKENVIERIVADFLDGRTPIVAQWNSQFATQMIADPMPTTAAQVTVNVTEDVMPLMTEEIPLRNESGFADGNGNGSIFVDYVGNSSEAM